MEVQLQPEILNIASALHRLKTGPSHNGVPQKMAEKPATPEGDFVMVRLEKKDMHRAMEFLKNFFFKDEPLNVAIKLLENETGRCEALEDFASSSMHEGVSLLAVSPITDEIMGVCLNGIVVKDQHVEEEPCPDPKFDKILTLLDRVERESDVFGKYPDVDRVMLIKIISVDAKQRGKGIATALLDKSKDLAKELNIPMMRADCTSHYSAKAVERLGYECIYRLPYADHKDSDGKTVFFTQEPHRDVTVYILRV